MARTTGSQPPSRFASGMSTDLPIGPLADSGCVNPFFYHELSDDFDVFNAAWWSGTATVVAGDGGLISIAAAATITTVNPGFLLPDTGANPPTTANSAKKIFFLARVMMPNATTAGFVAGLAAPGAAYGNPPTVDGLYFVKPAGAMTMSITNVVTAAHSPSGVAQTRTIAIPSAAVTPVLVNNQWFDIGFQLDRNQNLFGYVGVGLVGWVPQSGSGATTAAGTTIQPPRGKVVSNYNWLAQATGLAGNVATPMMYSNTPVAATIGASGSAVQVDFVCAQKER